MRILNIGFDKTLAGGRGLGDAVGRHREYGQHLESLDIIVYTTKVEGLTQHFKISDNVTGYPSNSSSKLSFIWDTLELAKSVHLEHPFDIIVAQDPLGAGLIGYLLKRKFGCKLQINFHGDYWDNDYWRHKSFIYSLLIPVSRFWVKRADGVRVVSEGIKKKLMVNGISESKIAVLPTPVNFSDFSSPDQNEVAKLRQQFTGKRVILHAGRHTAEKNLEALIDHFPSIIQQVPAAALVLAGEGPLTQPLKSQVAKLGLTQKVMFIGPVGPQILACYMAICDIFVLPSHTESFGKVLIEAALAGKPVVATATTGASEIVEDGKSGYLVLVADIGKLGERIVELLNNPDQASKMGEYANQLVRAKFNREHIIKGIIDFWKKLVNTKTAKGNAKNAK